MLFSSLIFLIVFLPAVLAIYYLPLRRFRAAQNVFLLLSSLFFYAWGEPRFVLVMMLSILANWIFGLLVNRSRESKLLSRAVIVLMLVFNLSIIFIFKYLMFAMGIVNSVFGAGLQIPEIALPIGISFFTFQAISYVVDVYRGRGAVQKNLLNVGLYISFFPQLIAGPIVRYQTIAEQIHGRKESREKFEQGVSRFIVGLCKKILIANNCALVANHGFYQIPAGNGSLALAWLSAIAYTLQIYYDFSGYSDMAIGLGRMFGFDFLENFNYPYISRSVSEFWRRWHISLGSWFRDYVYFPLGGSRVESKGRLIFNLFVVWLLTGLWHGANWTFIVWGLMYFVLISIEKLVSLRDRGAGSAKPPSPAGTSAKTPSQADTSAKTPSPAASRAKALIAYIYTMLFVVVGWVIFRSNDIASARAYIDAMFGINSLRPFYDWNFTMYLKDYSFYLGAGVLFSFPLVPLLKERLKDSGIAKAAGCVLLCAGLLLSLSFLMKGVYNPFIYFNF